MNPFKDTVNRWLTSALFVETNDTNGKYTPIFTLAEEDKPPYISLKRKYLEYLDPTEYQFALSIFGSYECWENLCKAPWFKEYVAQWRKEIELQIKFNNYATAKEIQKTGTAAEKLTATKYLSEEKWKTSITSKRGRPSNAQETDSLAHREKTMASILKSVKSGT